ncbi:MAG TPA: response regulator transcription factor [Cyclobacteriaceae bacterium]|nr:response regulator transcription factor [Cyclobacteriaceae bacterium]
MEYTCIIIDDELRAASRLKSLISDFTDLKVLHVETNPGKGIEKVCALNPDIVFLDIEMQRSGFNVIDTVKSRNVFPAFILVTAYPQYAIKAVKEAVFDYLMKPVDVDELQEAIKRFKKTRKSIITQSDIKLPLNPREKEVLVLLVQGLTSKQIAEKLFISKSTVETHRQNIRAKTGAKTTAELIALVLK